MGVYGKKLTALLLALCMVLGLVACGGGDDSADQLSGTIYMPEFIDLDLKVDYINSGYCDGQYVYVLGETNTPQLFDGSGQYVKDLTEEEASSFWESADAGADGSYVSYTSASKIYRVPLDGGASEELENFAATKIPEGTDGSVYISNIRGGQDGTLWVTEEMYVTTFELPADFDPATDDKWNYPSESTNTQIYRQLDSTGNELSRIDTTGIQEKVGTDYIQSVVMDPEGCFFVFGQTYTDSTSQTKIVVLDKDQNVLFTIEDENLWGQLTLLGDGTVGMNVWTEENGQVLRTIDKAAKDWGTEYPLPPNGGNIYTGSQKYIFYYDNGDSLYGFNKSTNAGEKLLSWSASDINKDEMMFFTFLEDGRVVAMTRSWGTNGSDMTTELAILTETDASVLKDKTILTYATQYLGYDERNRIIDFNKKSTKYRIEIKDYSEFNTTEDYQAGLTKLNTEIAAGNVPDIMNVSGLPLQQFGAKGLLEDLWPFIDNDADLGRDAIMENVFKAAEQDGKLYQIFSTFSIQTVVGATKVVGDRMSWTLDDLQAALATMPEGCTIFGEGDTKAGMLSMVLAQNQDSFVDWSTGQCSFDSENFISLLEFCNSFPLEYDWNSVDWDEYQDDNTRVMNGKQMLLQSYLYDLGDSLQLYQAVFGGDYSFIGFPREDGGVGSSFSLGTGIAMSSTCKDKEGAWSFMREYLMPQYADADSNSMIGMYNFSTNKADFEKMVEQAMKKEYQLDENGNQVLDENGQPIEVPKYTYGFNNMTVDVYATSQEQYDQFMALYNAIDSVYTYDENIYKIVNEVAGGYFNGDKNVQDTAKQIQDRVTLYINEQR